jgi:hypothetical protein
MTRSVRSRARVRYLLPPLGAVVIAIATACSNGGGGGATGGTGDTGGTGATGGTGGVEPIVVTVTPTPTGVLTCSTTQFSATIAGTTDTSGTWSMAPATGAGTISLDGLYTAPTATPAAPGNSVTVTATSAADPSTHDTTPAFTLATAFPSVAVPITGSTGDLVSAGVGIYQHAAASSGKTVYATWTVDEDTAGAVNMMVARSLDGGATWGTAVAAIHAQILDSNGGAISCPAVAVDAGNPNVVYAIGKVGGTNSISHAQGDATNDPAFVLSVSTDGGQTFTETVLSTSYSDLFPCADVASPAANTVVVTAPGGTDCGVYPDMYVWSDANRGAGFGTGTWDQNNQWWADGLNGSLYILKGGSDCTTDLAEAANGANGASGQVIESPRTFTDGNGHLCLAYAATPQAAGTIANVYVQCSPDGGLTFTQPVEIDPALGPDNQPVGAFGPGGLAAVAWVNVVPSENDQQLYLAVSTTAGATFGAPILVQTPAVPYSPSVYVDPAGIIWISYMVADGAAYALMVDKSCDNGATFSGAVQVHGSTSFGVMAPSLLGTGASAPIVVGLEDTMQVAYSLTP